MTLMEWDPDTGLPVSTMHRLGATAKQPPLQPPAADLGSICMACLLLQTHSLRSVEQRSQLLGLEVDSI